MENMKATEIIQQGLAHGESYDLIIYNEDGYVVKAVRINV